MMGWCWLALEGPGDTLGGGTSLFGDSQVDVSGLFVTGVLSARGNGLLDALQHPLGTYPSSVL